MKLAAVVLLLELVWRICVSRLETPMTLWFWHQVGGLLIEEFVAVRRTASQGQRLIDAVIVLGEKKRRL